MPLLVRWPAQIKAGQISNEIISHQDWLPTLLAAAGDADVKAKLKKGWEVGGRNYKVHLDGYNFLPHFTGEVENGPRHEFIYTGDTGEIVAYRYDDWKAVFREQTAHGLQTWINPWKILRAPKLFNLRMDPFERMEHEGGGYEEWFAEHMFAFVPMMAQVAKFKATFKEYPQRQKPGSFVP